MTEHQLQAYRAAYQALGSVRSYDYNLSRSDGFAALYRAYWQAVCAAGIRVTKRQALRAFTGPRDGYWTLADMAEYLARRCK